MITMTKQLIPAYEENCKPYKCVSLEEYIKITVLANTKDDVVNRINDYINLDLCSDEVKEILDYVLSNEELLNKVQIVHDASYRNCSMSIRYDDWFFNGMHYVEYGNVFDSLKYYAEHAEIFFIGLYKETKEEHDSIFDGAGYWEDDTENNYDEE